MRGNSRVFALAAAFLLAVVTSGKNLKSDHPDYVPDEKTAVRIAEAVLVGQFGEESVKARSPLHVASWGDGKYWEVGGHLLEAERPPQVPGPFAVLINKHDGCLSVVEHMK